MTATLMTMAKNPNNHPKPRRVEIYYRKKTIMTSGTFDRIFFLIIILRMLISFLQVPFNIQSSCIFKNRYPFTFVYMIMSTVRKIVYISRLCVFAYV